MDVNLDDDIRSNRARFQSEPKSSASRWVLIITIGVFLGSMAAWGTQRGLDYLFVKIAISEFNKQAARDRQASQRMLEKQRIKLEEQKLINAEKAAKRQLENEKRKAGLRQAMETCNFWRDQYRKEPNSSNQYQRDQSCNFVNEFR
jgi:hypothetical protein